jgi:hypothetical protein
MKQQIGVVLRLFVATGLAAGAFACVEREPLAPVEENGEWTAAFSNAPAPPGGQVTVSFEARTLQLWPFTGTDLAGSAADPVNVLFSGQVDVLSLRAAFLGLNGDRSAFGLPPVPPFNCVWKDTFGDVQTTFSSTQGWVGNPVQLACGAFGPVRFHLRLFPAGSWVIGGAHFDLLIPNTPEHQVVSWELAQQLVTIDMLRSGLLDSAQPLQMSAPITPVPGFRDIPDFLYNALPVELRDLIGGPPVPVTAPVPIANDGQATIFNLARRASIVNGSFSEAFTVPFDLVIPRPFCSKGPLDWVLVQGEVRVENSAMVSGDRQFRANSSLSGVLTVTPIDLATGMPSGPAFEALVENLHHTGISPAGIHINAIVKRIALPPATETQGSYITHLVIGPNEGGHFKLNERC